MKKEKVKKRKRKQRQIIEISSYYIAPENFDKDDFTFYKFENKTEFKDFLEDGNFGLRTVIMYKNLAFVQLISNGDVWLILIYDDDEGYESLQKFPLRSILCFFGDTVFYDYLNAFENGFVDL